MINLNLMDIGKFAVIVIIGIIFIIFIVKFVNVKIWKARNKKRMLIIAKQGEDASTVVADKNVDLKEKILTSASQIIGTRENQQDSFFVSGNSEFSLGGKVYTAASVCDGMGGLSSGEVASQMAVDVIKARFSEYFNKAGEKNIPEFLKKIAIDVNELVYNYGIENCNGKMCGTTMTLAILENNYLYWLSVGDSRIYIIRDRQIVQITKDHNYTYILENKVNKGEMTNEEALNEANREALISYIGMPELDIIDLSQNPFKLEKEDIVLLCSDGLTKVMTDFEICDYVSENKEDIDELAKSLPLISFDRNTGGQDNTTVAVVCYR